MKEENYKLAIQTSNYESISVHKLVNNKYSRVFYISNRPKDELKRCVDTLNRISKVVYGLGVTEIVQELPKNGLVKEIEVGNNETIIKLPEEFIYSDGELYKTEDFNFIINVLEGKLF